VRCVQDGSKSVHTAASWLIAVQHPFITAVPAAAHILCLVRGRCSHARESPLFWDGPEVQLGRIRCLTAGAKEEHDDEIVCKACVSAHVDMWASAGMRTRNTGQGRAE
jgi:hypothetical protein